MKRHHYCKFTIEEEKIITGDYEKGLSYIDLCKKYEVSQRCIFNIMKAYNVKARPNRTYFFNEKAFDKLDSEQSLYWLGFIYADAAVNYRAVRFGLAEKDTQHLYKMRDFMQGDMPVRVKNGVCTLEFHSVHLGRRIKKLGIVPHRGKFHILKSQIPLYLRNHFIRGYMDGDGCISTSEQVVFLGQKDILTWVRNVVHNQCRASLNKLRKRQGTYETGWGGIDQARRIVRYIYQDATIWLERKKNVADNWRK